jgi:protein-disulfide isomerase
MGDQKRTTPDPGSVDAQHLARKRFRRCVDALWGLSALTIVFATVMFARSKMKPNGGTDSRVVKSAGEYTTAGIIVGDSSAPVRVVEFADFECAHCRRFQQTLTTLRTRHPKLVAVVFRHFPISTVGFSLPAAIAAECAAAGGRFPRFADLLFNSQDTLSHVSFGRLAVLAGVVDTVRFNTCRGSSRAREDVNRDIEAALTLKINATPTFLVGDQLVVGEVTLEKLEELVARASNERRALR